MLDAGLTDDAIARRVRKGHLHRVHVGVYAVGRPPQTALERAGAAILACGPTAALSHFCALALYGLRERWPSRLEVTVTRDRAPKGIKTHRVKGLDPRKDLRTHSGIRVTSAARTLLDCAPLLPHRALTRAVNDAQLAGHMKRWQLAELLARCPHHPGAKRLREFVETVDGPTRSEFEDAFVDFCERFGLPGPRMGVKVGRYTVDALFEAEKLIVELDGYRYHSSRNSFESDRIRDADLLALGYGTVRLTWGHLSEREADRLLAILASRGSVATPAAPSIRSYGSRG